MNILLNKVIFTILAVLLLSSVVFNIYQHLRRQRDLVYHEEVVRDTVVELDTVYVTKTEKVTIEKPVPVHIIDTVENIKVYRDTIFHKYGWIETNETVVGDLLSKGLEYKLDIPTYYKTRTITNTITKTVRNNLFYLTGGFNYNFADQQLYPSIGATYIWNGHKRIISLEYSLEKRIDLNVGISLWR